MRVKILILGLVCLLFFSCGTPLSRLTQLYPQESDFLFSKMVQTLQELEWTIENMDRPTLFISAKKLTKGEALSAALSGEMAPHSASINFIKKNGDIELSIQVSQPGKIMKYSKVCERLANEIKEKFEENIGKQQIR